MEEKVYFKEGDVVYLKQNIANSPEMIVEKIEKIFLPGNKVKKLLIGIRTFWFTKDGAIQKGRFNFKDLKKKEK